jgi:hypothetical protein
MPLVFMGCYVTLDINHIIDHVIEFTAFILSLQTFS